jgi:hypothetical protein
MIGRIMASLRFPGHEYVWRAGARFNVTSGAALDPRPGFGERHRDRFLNAIIKNGGGAEGDDAGGKAGGDEHTHGASPSHSIRPTFESGGRRPKRRGELDAGKTLGFNVHKDAAKCAHARVEIGRFSPFEIDKKRPDPG